MNKGNEFNNSYLRGLTGQPVKKPKRIIDEVIETASADPVIVRVSEDNPLYDYRASGTGMTLKGDALIAALAKSGVDWPSATQEEVVEVPIARVEPAAPVVETVVTEDVPLRPTGNSIFERIVNGERWELKGGRWQPALPSEAEVYGTNVNYEYDPVAEGDIDGPRMIVAENTADYGTPKTTIVEQILAKPPVNWKNTELPEAAIQQQKKPLSARFMTDAARRAFSSREAEVFLNSPFRFKRHLKDQEAKDLQKFILEHEFGLNVRQLREDGLPTMRENLNALSPDGIRYYEQPVEVEMAQVMPENVPIKPTYESMILDDLRQKALDDINRVAVDEIPVEAIIDDADNPRLAGTLLQDPRVRLGLAGAGGAGLLAVIAHNIGQNREARRQEAQRNLNYPIRYDNGY